jgi:hypothetical protein
MIQGMINNEAALLEVRASELRKQGKVIAQLLFDQLWKIQNENTNAFPPKKITKS